MHQSENEKVEILSQNLVALDKSLARASRVNNHLIENPPTSFWSGIGHLLLGGLCVAEVTLSGAILLDNGGRFIDGKPLRRPKLLSH